MCLDQVTKRNPRKTHGFGWKVFRDAGEWGLYPECQGRGKPYEINKWCHEEQWRHYVLREQIATGYSPPFVYYPAGFHIFKRKKDAKIWAGTRFSKAIRKVEYKSAVCVGKQIIDGLTLVLGDVVVAKEMRILPTGGE
jgi:hypothetical protein